ncbi:MAG TPA: histidine kinase, partial [Vicinamibacteria bacterium]|nr:histidine kinase [Vicinamibacteria bacterium]
LVPSSVISLGEDAEGNLWMGTRAGGAMRLLRHGFVGESSPGSAGGDLVTSFVEERPGQVWAVLAPGRLRRYAGRAAVTVRLPIAPAAFRVGRPGPYPGMLRDRQGEWWVGTAEGLYRFPAVTVEALPRTRPRAIYTTGDGLAGDGIGVLFEDRAGDVWIGHTTSGPRVLSRWARRTGRVAAYGAADGLPASYRVTALAEDASGLVFAGFYEGGLVRKGAAGFERLPGFAPVEMGTTTALHLDGAGRLWVATSRGGLRWLSGTSGPLAGLAVHSLPEPLASNALRTLTDDAWGRLYAAGLGGIDCIDPVTLRSVRRFTQAHGLRNHFFEAARRDARGRLWFGTSEGLARIDPENWRPRPPSPVRIGSLRVAGAAQAVADVGQEKVGPLSLAAEQNSLDVEYFALDFGGEPRLFQYRLLGAGAEWSAPTARAAVQYGHLGPGRYRFQVRALSAGGQAGPRPAEVEFTIVPPLWGRAWFRAAALAAMGLLGYGAFRLRVARLVALERVRTRIAADLHDDIGSSLSQIAILSELARRRLPPQDGVEGPLDRIAESSRELVDDMSDIVWAINP